MAKKRRKDVLTTGEAATICGVSQQTIIRCFDNGALKGFRVPKSRFRRIPIESLEEFMVEWKIPLIWLEEYREKNGISNGNNNSE